MLRIIIYLLAVAVVPAVSENAHLEREKRSFLVYPNGGVYKLITGIAIPIKLGLKQSMGFGLNLQYQYRPAQNYSQLTVYPPIISRDRDKRQVEKSDRAMFYMGLESLMNRYGINGSSCVLRSICDNAMESLHHDANGVFGHLLHIILTPNYGDGEVDPDLDPKYFEAQRAGEYGVDCISLFPSCPYGHGFLDFVSMLYN